MSVRNVDLPEAETVTVGFIGQPGSRVFYLQVLHAGDVHTFKVEKQQVAALASAIEEMLADVVVDAPVTLPDVREPGAPDWVVGTMGLTTIDVDTGRALLVLHELVPDEEAENASVARLGLTPPQLAALGLKCEQSIAGGRPNCELCGRPMDPEGHVCPKTNGSAKH